MASSFNSFRLTMKITMNVLFFGPTAFASGLDVQLKDLRGSYYHTVDGKECAKLTSAEIKKYGRLTHCKPEENHVMCRAKGETKIFAFEAESACKQSIEAGADPGEGSAK